MLFHLSVLLIWFFIRSSLCLPEDKIIHLPLRRRGSRHTQHEPANLTRLAEEIVHIETRYTRTYRTAKHNRLVRRWRPDLEDQTMFDGAGTEGQWYTIIDIGSPVQSLEVDIDMLSPDWYTIMTSSTKGSKYDTFLSNSHVTMNDHIHSMCHLSSDIFHLPISKHSQRAERLAWPICQPSHSSVHTLQNSGTILGLAPNSKGHRSSLSRLHSGLSFVTQLHDLGMIQQPIWSITILDGDTGILSLGGSLAKEMEEIKGRVELELEYLGQERRDDSDIQMRQDIEKKVENRVALLGDGVEDQFRWIEVSGAEGWWMGLISGIWVNGVKIQRNQPFILDLTSPFIHAPGTSFTHLYSSLPSSQFISDIFATIPCSNPPQIAFEIGGWTFNLASLITRFDALHGAGGGWSSLGKITNINAITTTTTNSTNRNHNPKPQESINTGLCIGIIISQFRSLPRPTHQQSRSQSHSESKPIPPPQRNRNNPDQSGTKNAWILGEPFFRGMGLVFDDRRRSNKKARIGFRKF